MNEWTYVISTINAVLGVDILNGRRNRELVDARTIFYYIMRRDFNKGVSAIGRHVHKSHATVLHSLKNFDILFKSDKKFKEDYQKVVSVLNGAEDVGLLLTEEDIKKMQEENSYLLSHNELLTLELDKKSKKIKALEKDMLKFSFYAPLFDRISHAAPQGKEEELLKKINTFLNGIRL